MKGLTCKICNLADLADQEEERRLMFVAYTRAKKLLHVYYGRREMALDNGQMFSIKDEKKLGYSEYKPGLDRYNLGFLVRDNYPINERIAKEVRRSDPVEIELENGSGNANILWNSITIGRLSKKSFIRNQMITDKVNKLSGFFISEICVWEYKDSVWVDEKNKQDVQNRVRGSRTTNYAGEWSDVAKDNEQGFVYVVNIAGFGQPKK